MIVIKLQGGLGNQLFQYAAGRALAHMHSTELVLDINWFSNVPAGVTSREYLLSAYDIKARLTNRSENILCKFHQNKIISRLSLPFMKWRHIREKCNDLYENFHNYPDDIYLDGYWQSYRYFETVSNFIREEFQIKNHVIQKNLELETEIKNSVSIGVHVRRGDYVTNMRAASYHGICSLDYYNSSFEHIGKSIANPQFFIFSDDIDWAVKNIKTIYPVKFVVDYSGQPQDHLRLISMCRHQIIANSSFSWWGAWLNSNPNKIVIAPKKWFAFDKNTNNLCPSNWIKL